MDTLILPSEVSTILGAFANTFYGQTESGELVTGTLKDPSRIPAAYTDKEAAAQWRKLLTSVTIRPSECVWHMADVDAQDEFVDNLRDQNRRRFGW